MVLSCCLQADEYSRVHLSTFEDILTHYSNDSVVSHSNIHSLPLFLSWKETCILTKAILTSKRPIQHFSPSWRTLSTVPLCRSSTVILIVELKCLAGVQDATGLKILKTRYTAMMRKAIPTRMTPKTTTPTIPTTPKTTPPKTPNSLLPPPLQILPLKPPPPLPAAHCSSR